MTRNRQSSRPRRLGSWTTNCELRRRQHQHHRRRRHKQSLRQHAHVCFHMLRNLFPLNYHSWFLFNFLFGYNNIIISFANAFPAMQSVPSTSITIPSSANNDLTLVGRSRAGDGTTFIIPQLRWMFDCGALVEGGGLKQPQIIWLTHTHSDHIFTLAHFTHRRELSNLKKSTKMQVYLPAKALPFVKSYLKAYSEMVTMERMDDEEEHEGSNNSNNNKPKSKSSSSLYELIPVVPNQEIHLKQNGKEFLIKVVECDHRIDCVGYSIFEKQKKLKDEYRGLEGREIGELRKQGIEITSVLVRPLLCYLGDTTHKVFDNHPEILKQHSMIVVECSFLDEQTVENAIQHKHMHWDDLSTIVNSNPTILFVLIHFSLRHSTLHLRDFFTQQSAHNNVHPMLIESEIQAEWNAKNQKE